MQLYLDMDGVLADFDRRAAEILNMKPREFEDLYGSERFWKTLAGTHDFYNSFQPMPDAHIFYNFVAHLNPKILTGVPQGEWAAPQKRVWVSRYFPDVEVICCPSREKSKFCEPGDILIDDMHTYIHRWERKGGRYIVHKSTYLSFMALSELGVI